MKPFSSLLLFSGLLTGQAMATPASELESLALLRSQFNQLQTTLSRAEAQARVSADSRFFFDYPRVFADLRTMRRGRGTLHFPLPCPASAGTALVGEYRREATS